MHCRRPWDALMLSTMMPSGFLKGEWLGHQRLCAARRQTALMAETAPLVARWKEAEELRERAQAARDEAEALREQIERLEAKADELEETADAHEERAHELEGPPIADGPVQAEEGIDREAVPCAREGCKGFLLPDTTCSICGHTTCPRCMSYVGPPGESSEHQCSPENLASAAAVVAGTKKCPGCGSRVHKVQDGGCDQMWCTQCHTAFSWRTGIRVVRGPIHNPHYFEHLRAAGGNLPHAEGELPCGGLCTIVELGQALAQIPGECRYQMEKMRRIHRVLDGAIIDHELPDADLRRQGQLGREGRLDEATELRVQYLLGHCTDEELAARAKGIEDECAMWQGVYEALWLYAQLASDAMRTVVRSPTRAALALAHNTLAWAGANCNRRLCEIHLIWKKRVPLLGHVLDPPRNFPLEGGRRRLTRVHPKVYRRLLSFVETERPRAAEKG